MNRCWFLRRTLIGRHGDDDHREADVHVENIDKAEECH